MTNGFCANFMSEGGKEFLLFRNYHLWVGGKSSPVILRVSPPETSDGKTYCQYSILGLGYELNDVQIFGDGPVQAIFLTLQAVSEKLYSAGKPPGRHVYWKEPGDVLGLPFSDSIAGLVKSRKHPSNHD